MKIAVLAVFFVFAFFVVILFFPFKVAIKSYVDLVQNIGVYCFRLYGLRILCGRAWIEKHKLKFENQHHRFEQRKQLSQLEKVFAGELYRNMDVVAIDIYFEGGKQDDAYFSAMLCGSVQTIVSIVFSYLKTKNMRGSLRKNIMFLTEDNACNFVIDAAVCVTLFGVIKSFVSARIKMAKAIQTNAEGKHNEQHNRSNN